MASVAQDFFGRLNPVLKSFGPVTENFYGDGDHVFVVGHYHAVAHSGAEADVRFVHEWTVTDGKLTVLRQAADSHVLQQLLTEKD